MLLLLLTVFADSVFAESPHRSGDSLTYESKGSTFTGHLAEGFHFNEKGPNQITVNGLKTSPSKVEKREIEFTGLVIERKTGEAKLYICDDAVTFCEMRSVVFGTTPASTPLHEKKSGPKVSSHGFIEGDYAAAVNRARLEKKLLLVDFSARWCPGCVRLESEVFGTQKFKDLTKNLIKVHLDVDRFENGVLGEKFKIQGIPTLLVLNADQLEIQRVYDYQPIEVLDPFFTSIRNDPTPVGSLLERAKSGDNISKLVAGKRLLAAGSTDAALLLLSSVIPAPTELADAEVEFAESAYGKDKSTRAEYVKTLRRVIVADGKSSRSLGWRTKLISILEDKVEIEKVRKEGVSAADQLLGDSVALLNAVKSDLIGEFTHYESLLVATERADLISEAQPDPVVSDRAWKEAAQVVEKLKITARTPGPALRALLVLTQAKEYQSADRLSLELLKNDPINPEIQRRRIKILMGLGKPGEAIPLAEKVLKSSFGRNEFWVAESLAKAYLAAGRKPDAVVVLDRYLGRTDLAWNTMQGTKRSLETLRKTATE